MPEHVPGIRLSVKANERKERAGWVWDAFCTCGEGLRDLTRGHATLWVRKHIEKIERAVGLL